MSLIDFIQNSRDRTFKQNLGELVVGYRRRTKWLDKRSTHIFEKDWDVLCILDACRYDLMQEVSEDYEYLENIESIYSVGATSPMWLENTFSNLSTDELENTGYVTGNPWSSRLDLNFDSLAVFDELWRTTWDDDRGYQPPRPLTDRAISLCRERNDLDRLIIHYMQPHVPFVNNPNLSREMSVTVETPERKTIWKKVRDGEIDRDRVWDVYADNLRYVLDEIDILRENLAVDTLAISADHGNAMGELGQAGHEYGTLVRSACEVPWIKVNCTDTKTHEPDSASDFASSGDYFSSDDSEIVEDRLSALGYSE